MPRSKAGVKKPAIDSLSMKNAVLAINSSADSKITLREASKVYGVSIASLQRQSKKYKEAGYRNYEYQVNYATRKIFFLNVSAIKFSFCTSFSPIL